MTMTMTFGVGPPCFDGLPVAQCENSWVVFEVKQQLCVSTWMGDSLVGSTYLRIPASPRLAQPPQVSVPWDLIGAAIDYCSVISYDNRYPK